MWQIIWLRMRKQMWDTVWKKMGLVTHIRVWQGMNLTVRGSSLGKRVSPRSPCFPTGGHAEEKHLEEVSKLTARLLLKKLVDVLKFQQNFANPWRRMPSGICIHYVSKSRRPQDWKRSTLIPIAKKGSNKECANHQRIVLISHASKVMLKILHARLQHCENQELPDVQAGFRKGRGTRHQVANMHWVI